MFELFLRAWNNISIKYDREISKYNKFMFELSFFVIGDTMQYLQKSCDKIWEMIFLHK